jgi:hypothetical protein
VETSTLKYTNLLKQIIILDLKMGEERAWLPLKEMSCCGDLVQSNSRSAISSDCRGDGCRSIR